MSRWAGCYACSALWQTTSSMKRADRVEEDLRAAGAIGAVVELSGFRCREPGPQPQDRHELVVIPLGSREVRNTYADVVDESGSGRLLLLPMPMPMPTQWIAALSARASG
jgi:hypothetical protein